YTPSSRDDCCISCSTPSMGSRLAYLETPEGGTRSSSHRVAIATRWIKVAVIPALGQLRSRCGRREVRCVDPGPEGSARGRARGAGGPTSGRSSPGDRDGTELRRP